MNRKVTSVRRTQVGAPSGAPRGPRCPSARRAGVAAGLRLAVRDEEVAGSVSEAQDAPTLGDLS